MFEKFETLQTLHIFPPLPYQAVEGFNSKVVCSSSMVPLARARAITPKVKHS